MNEKAFGTKEVSEVLKVGDSTLRKWCIALEKEGYTFTKAVRNSRAFIQKDIVVLEDIKLLLQESGNTLIEYTKVQEKLLERVERIERSHEECLKDIEEKLDYCNKLLLETLQEIQDTKKVIAVTKEKKWWKF